MAKERQGVRPAVKAPPPPLLPTWTLRCDYIARVESSPKAMLALVGGEKAGGAPGSGLA